MAMNFTLEEALRAANNPNVKPNFSNKTKAKSGLTQLTNKEIRERQKIVKKDVVEDNESVGVAPIAKTEPGEDPAAKHLRDLIDQFKGQRDEVEQKLKAKEPEVEVFEEEPPLIRSLAVVEITDRKQVQKLHGAQAVQRVKGQQNVVTEDGAKWAAEQTTMVGQIGTGIVIGAENYLAHPIANLQNMFREPFERRDISFSDRVNLMIKNVIFPNNPELALKLPDEFVEELLKVGQEKRGKKLNKILNNLKDLMLWNTAGFTMDTQQKRALEYLAEVLSDPTNPKFIDLKEKSLAYSANLAHGFAITLTDGKDLLPDQKKIGDSQVLLPGESRTEVPFDKNVILENRIKDEVLKKFFAPTAPPPTAEEKLLMIKQINQIYREEGLITKKSLEENEFANDIVLELEDMLKHKDFFWKKWAEVRFVNYTGTSKGEALGGQERFTWNEKLSLTVAATDSKIEKGKGLIPPAVAALKATNFFGGYIVAGMIGAGKFLPRWAASSKIARAAPLLGPLWSGFYGASTESLDYIDPFDIVHIRESRVVSQQRQVSQAKALGRSAGELDLVRQQLEREATVTPVPATELTKSILNSLLKDPGNWNSETKDLDSAKVLSIFMNIAHARARIEATHKSGSRELRYTTQNWIQYNEGFEQKELTDLKAAAVQGLCRLMFLQDQPDLFKDIPFYDPSNPESLEATLKTMAEIMTFGFIQGFPLQILDDSPLNGNKSAKFYKQIFKASGISKDEIAEGEKFIAILKDADTVFGGKKMSQWLDESESFKARYKSLKKLKGQRAIVTGTVSMAVGAIAALGKTELGPVTQSVQTHLIQPIEDHFGIAHQQPQSQPKPATTAAPDQAPQPLTIEFDNIFKASKDAFIQRFHIYDAHSGKTSDVGIPLAHGFRFLSNSDPSDKNVDIQGPDGKIYDNVFVFDKAHQALVPNDHFVPPGTTSEVDLGDVLNFRTENQPGIGGGESFNLWDKVDDFRLVWGHSKEIKPDKSFIFETTGTGHESHPNGIEIRFADDSIRDPNTGAIASLFSHFHDNSMAAVLDIKDFFGPGKDGHLLLNDCIDKMSDEKGRFYGSLKFDPTSDKVVSFADGTQTTMGQIAQFILDQKELAKHPNIGNPNDTEFHGANVVFGFKGSILIGYKTEAPDTIASNGGLSGHHDIPGGGERTIFEPVHYVSANGIRNDDAMIAAPGKVTLVPTISLIPPQPVEVPVEPALHAEALGQANPTPNSTDLTPLIDLATQRWYSPQLNPTTGGPPTPASSTPLPQSIINSAEFKKEPTLPGYDNSQALKFLDQLAIDRTTDKRIDEFIYDHTFTKAQSNFLRSNKTKEFIDNQIRPVLNNRHPIINAKLLGDDQNQLSDSEKQTLRDVVLRVANDYGLTNQEALTIGTYLINRAFLDSLHSALQEKKQLDEELRHLNESLNAVVAANATPIPPTRINPPPANPPPFRRPLKPKPNQKIEIVKPAVPLVDINENKKVVSANILIKMFQKEERPEPVEEELRWISHNEALLNRVESEILQKIMGENRYQGETFIKLQQIRDQFVNMLYVGDEDTVIRNELSQLIREFNGAMRKADKNFKQKITNVSELIRAHDKEIKNVTVDLKTGKIILPEAKDDKVDRWLDDLVPKKNPDHAVATGLKFDDDEKAGGGELRKSFEDYSKFSKKIEELKQKANKRKSQIEAQGGDEFSYFSDLEWKKVNDELKAVTRNLENSGSSISQFEQNQLPIILGGTLDSIVANTHDERQDVYWYYHHGFRDAFRNYMVDYVSRGRDADNAEIRMAFNKLKNDLNNIDSNVFLVRFEDFMNGIRASV